MKPSGFCLCQYQLLDFNSCCEYLMKKLLSILGLTIMACSSKTPVDMDQVLFERGGQYITTKGYNTSLLGFLYNEKVYNGPGFFKHRNGEKREQGPLKNGFRSGVWTGWDNEGKKKFSGEYQRGRPHGEWTGFHANGKKKYQGNYKYSFQVGKWTYFNSKGSKTLEENYFNCDDECDESHPDIGKLVDSKNF